MVSQFSRIVGRSHVRRAETFTTVTSLKRSSRARLNNPPRVGDKVEIVYDPQSPEVMCACDPAEQLVIVDSEAPLTAIILAVVGILFGLALHSTFQRYRKEFYG